MSDFPTLVRGDDERHADTLSEFHQLRYDGWALKDHDAEINGEVPNPSPEDQDITLDVASGADANPLTPLSGVQDDGPPPLGGAGSGVEAWRSYARGLTDPAVDVDGLDTREQIVDAINTAGHPTERSE